jgi:hypothetical protein
MAAAAAADARSRLAGALHRVIELRRGIAADRDLGPRVMAVKRWQAQRLRRTYADLLATPRYQPACEFFLDELYGTRDFTQRDTEALRVVSTLVRMLPERAVVTLAMGSELDELSETLDARVAKFIAADARGVAGETVLLNDDDYVAAYRAAGTRAEREWQIAHIVQIGLSLDKLAKLPLISGMLHLMRGPAEAAGLSHLHEFLSGGFDSFHAMRGAREFLDAVRERETALMESMLAQQPPI